MAIPKEESGFLDVWVPKQELEEQICIPSEAISYVNTISIPAAGEGPKSK